MATHYSVLAWRIPGAGEPGGLPSIGSQSQTQLKRLSSSIGSFIFFNIFILFLAVLGVHCCTGFSSCCSKQGLLSSCGAQASHWSGLSCSREWAVGHSRLQ